MVVTETTAFNIQKLRILGIRRIYLLVSYDSQSKSFIISLYTVQ